MRAWLLGTPLPDDLAAEGRATIDHLRSDAPEADRAARAIAFITATTEHGLEHHFRTPLDRLGVGRITQQAVGVALGLALKGLRRPLRSVLDGMDDAQLRTVADEIEVRLYPDPHG
ncbi:MAG: hypothetical protein AAF845_15415 [Bacteroidota bacterium]